MVEGIELFRAVDSRRVQELQRKRGEHELAEEKHDGRRIDSRQNQRQQIVHQVDPVHELVHADGSDDARDHHDAEYEGEHGIAQLPLISHQRVGGQRGEIHGQRGGADGDNQRIDEAGGRVKGLAGEDLEVVNQMCGRNQRYRLLLDLKGAAGRVDEHDHKREKAQNRQKNADNINQCANDGIAVSSFKLRHIDSSSLTFCPASGKR